MIMMQELQLNHWNLQVHPWICTFTYKFCLTRSIWVENTLGSTAWCRLMCSRQSSGQDMSSLIPMGQRWRRWKHSGKRTWGDGKIIDGVDHTYFDQDSCFFFAVWIQFVYLILDACWQCFANRELLYMNVKRGYTGYTHILGPGNSQPVFGLFGSDSCFVVRLAISIHVRSLCSRIWTRCLGWTSHQCVKPFDVETCWWPVVRWLMLKSLLSSEWNGYRWGVDSSLESKAQRHLDSRVVIFL